MKSRQSLSNLFVLFCWLFFWFVFFLFFCRLLLLLCDAWLARLLIQSTTKTGDHVSIKRWWPWLLSGNQIKFSRNVVLGTLGFIENGQSNWIFLFSTQNQYDYSPKINSIGRKSPNSTSKSEKQREQQQHQRGNASGTFHSTISSSDLAHHHHHHHLLQHPDGQRHIFQENTYKKITPCDVCSQVLRGKVFSFFVVSTENVTVMLGLVYIRTIE